RKLKELNLLHSMHAQTELVTGERVGLSAFWVVDRPRLKTLSPAVLADLVQTDATETIYAHLISMGNFASITDRLLRASHPGEAVQ
ncbi:MAG: SapC family protein, partial [Pyrinomonadaceae bacterium]